MSDDKTFDKEAIYDEQIAPLMTQIINICKEHEITALASFEYASGQLCTTALNYTNNREFVAALKMIREGLVGFTVRTVQP